MTQPTGRTVQDARRRARQAAERTSSRRATALLVAYLALLLATATAHNAAYEVLAFAGGMALVALAVIVAVDIAQSPALRRELSLRSSH